MQKLYRELLLI